MPKERLRIAGQVVNPTPNANGEIEVLLPEDGSPDSGYVQSFVSAQCFEHHPELLKRRAGFDLVTTGPDDALKTEAVPHRLTKDEKKIIARWTKDVISSDPTDIQRS